MAYFKLIASQKEEGTILYTGKLEINYIDGVYIQNPELVPMNTPNYNTYSGVYRNSFAVSSSGTLDQTIELELEVAHNSFSDGVMKYILYNKNGEKIATGFIPKTGKATLASNIYLAPTATAEYTLIMWLNNTGYNQNDQMGKNISGKINIHSKQLRY